MNRVWTAFALLLPIVVLAGITVQRQFNLQGREVILAIEGYDPRDFLSGHYVTYRVNYGISGLCRDLVADDREQPGYVCLEPRFFASGVPQAGSCVLVLRGHCQGGRFVAGIERFYIPEGSASLLDQAVRGKRGEIVVVVSGDGVGQVKELLIDGRSWRELSGE